MCDGGDMGGDIGGDIRGGDMSVDIGSDMGGDLASDTGAYLSEDISGDFADDALIEAEDIGDTDLSDIEDGDLSGFENNRLSSVNDDLSDEEGDNLNGVDDGLSDEESDDLCDEECDEEVHDLNGADNDLSDEEGGDLGGEEDDNLGGVENGDLDDGEGNDLNEVEDGDLIGEEDDNLSEADDGNHDGEESYDLDSVADGAKGDESGDEPPDIEQDELDLSSVESDNGNDIQSNEGEKTTEADPFNDDGSLKPNIEYTTGEYGYQYETDENGRISSFKTDNLQLTEREDRLPHNGQTIDKGELDDAGHLLGDRFGGSPELDNLVSQDAHINRSEYKAMENEWADAIRNGSHVEVSGEVKYDDDSHRPSSFDVFYSIDDEVYEKSFTNRRE